MHQHLIDTVHRSRNKPDGMGMSLRPAYYAGTSARAFGECARLLMVFYREIQVLIELEEVPAHATSEYLKLVRQIPLLRRGPFMAALIEWSLNDYRYQGAPFRVSGDSPLGIMCEAFASASRDESQCLYFTHLYREQFETLLAAETD